MPIQLVSNKKHWAEDRAAFGEEYAHKSRPCSSDDNTCSPITDMRADRPSQVFDVSRATSDKRYSRLSLDKEAANIHILPEKNVPSVLSDNTNNNTLAALNHNFATTSWF